MEENINELNSQFNMDLLVLKMMLESINASIHLEIEEIDTAITELRNDLQDSLISLSSLMGEMETDVIHQVGEMIDHLDETTLGEIKLALDDLSQMVDQDDEEILALISDLQYKMETFDTNMTKRVQNISSLMATIEAVDEITGEMEGIQDDLGILQSIHELMDEIDEDQKDTSKSVSSNTNLLWIILIIAILVLGIQIYLGIRRILSSEDREETEKW
jgi:hypothetical protein